MLWMVDAIEIKLVLLCPRVTRDKSVTFGGAYRSSAVPWNSHPKGEVPTDHYTVPFGRAEIVRAGSAVTIIAYGTMLHVVEAAAASMGLDAEIIDVRSLVPLDVDTLCNSVCRTGRCLIAHEATRFAGFGAELAATVMENCFWN